MGLSDMGVGEVIGVGVGVGVVTGVGLTGLLVTLRTGSLFGH